MSETTLHPPVRIPMLGGYIEVTVDSKNEISIVSTINDPPAVRFASPGGGLGKLSFNAMINGVQREMVLIQGKNDEDDRGTAGVWLGGSFTIHCRRSDVALNDPHDDGMRMVMDGSTKRIVFGVPVALPGSASASGLQARLMSPNGKYVLNLQDDGNFVEYDTHNSADESTWTAIWVKNE